MNCCNSWFRNRSVQGFTLIEVIVGLALMGSLLAAVTLATARYKRQLTLAEAKLEAVHVAQSVLAQWWQESFDAIPRNGSGEVTSTDSTDGLSWRTHELPLQGDEPMGFAVVRFELYDQKQAKPESPLLTVDLAIAEPIEEESEFEANEPDGEIESEMDQADDS